MELNKLLSKSKEKFINTKTNRKKIDLSATERPYDADLNASKDSETRGTLRGTAQKIGKNMDKKKGNL